MSRYLIKEVKCDVAGGGQFFSKIIASIRYEVDGTEKWIHAIEIQDMLEVFIRKDDVFDVLVNDEYDTDYLEKLRASSENEIGGIRLEGSYEEIFDTWYEGPQISETDASFIRFVLVVIRIDWDELEELKEEAIGKFTDEIEIPMTDVEEEYLEENGLNDFIDFEEEDSEEISDFDRIFLDENFPRERYEEYQKEAAKGDPIALSELGNIDMVNGFYYHDEERKLRGIHYIAEAAERGHGPSATFLGFLYLNGKYGVARDPDQAIAWFKKGAELGDKIGQSQYEMASAQRDAAMPQEKAVEKDSEENEEDEVSTYIDEDFNQEKYEILQKAAFEGKPVALYEYGMVEVISGYQDHDDERIAAGMRYLHEAVEKGNGAAATYLGTIFHEGKFGFPQDMAIAVSYYKKGAKMGDPLGMSNYAISLQRGDGGLQKNDAEAFMWLKAAADAGLGIAQYNTALALHAGRGVKIDRKEAKKYFQMAAKNGIKMAEMWLYSLDYQD